MRILARISSSTYLDFKEVAKYPVIFGQLAVSKKMLNLQKTFLYKRFSKMPKLCKLGLAIPKF